MSNKNEQLNEKEGKLPDVIIACVGGGSNAIGIFNEFIREEFGLPEVTIPPVNKSFMDKKRRQEVIDYVYEKYGKDKFSNYTEILAKDSYIKLLESSIY